MMIYFCDFGVIILLTHKIEIGYPKIFDPDVGSVELSC